MGVGYDDDDGGVVVRSPYCGAVSCSCQSRVNLFSFRVKKEEGGRRRNKENDGGEEKKREQKVMRMDGERE